MSRTSDGNVGISVETFNQFYKEYRQPCTKMFRNINRINFQCNNLEIECFSCSLCPKIVKVECGPANTMVAIY